MLDCDVKAQLWISTPLFLRSRALNPTLEPVYQKCVFFTFFFTFTIFQGFMELLPATEITRLCHIISDIPLRVGS